MGGSGMNYVPYVLNMQTCSCNHENHCYIPITVQCAARTHVYPSNSNQGTSGGRVDQLFGVCAANYYCASASASIIAHNAGSGLERRLVMTFHEYMLQPWARLALPFPSKKGEAVLDSTR